MKCIRMKKVDLYKGWCWKYALACILEVNPDMVPPFSGKKEYINQTRHWLKRKFKKGMVYVQANQFLENTDWRQNPPIGPSGYSIMVVDTNDPDSYHAVIAKDGKLFWDSSENDFNDFTHVLGYYIIYDLE